MKFRLNYGLKYCKTTDKIKKNTIHSIREYGKFQLQCKTLRILATRHLLKDQFIRMIAKTFLKHKP